MTDRAVDDPVDPQPHLFDVAAADQPVPFSLTARGRRAVDVEMPDLRVVPDVEDGPAQDRRRDQRVDHQLASTDGALHARVRALRRAGADRSDIAERLDLEPLAVAVLDADDEPVPVDGGLPGDRVGDRSAAPRDEATSRHVEAVSVLAAIGEIDDAGVTATTARIGVVALLVSWLRQERDVRAGAIRIVLRVADAATADVVARAWADRLGLGRDRVSTVPWRRAAGPRDVQAVLRVNGRALAADLRADLAAWPG